MDELFYNIDNKQKLKLLKFLEANTLLFKKKHYYFTKCKAR